MLAFFALVLMIVGIITAEVGKPDSWNLDNDTGERIDPLTPKENAGFIMIGIAFAMFIVSGVSLLF